MMHRLLLLTICLLLAAACSHHRSTVSTTNHRSTVNATVDSVRTNTATHSASADCTAFDTLAARAVKHDTVQHALHGVVVKRGDTLAWKLTAFTVAAAEQRMKTVGSKRLQASERTYEDEILRYLVAKSAVTDTTDTQTVEHQPAMSSGERLVLELLLIVLSVAGLIILIGVINRKK